ncbi:ABC transporter ATP-binding protein, partial [Halomonas sp. 707D4]|nr:ABC transporter ATP-binding protein [Halomonas sp. 707D4]
SNLDAAIRRSLRGELRRLQKSLGVTTVMVTHDQEEALQMADQIVLMRDGRIVQVAPPATLYQAPADLDAARFLGVDNVVERTAEDPAALQGATRLGFRTRDARLDATADAGALRRRGTVIECVYTGDGYQVSVETQHQTLFAVTDAPVEPGRFVTLTVPARALMPFGADHRRLSLSHSQEHVA